MQKLTMGCAMAMLSIGLLRALTNEARDAVTMVKRARKFKASSIVFREDSARSSKTQIAKIMVP
jgi:hypothetical protein